MSLFCIGTTAILIKSFEFLVLVDVVFSAFSLFCFPRRFISENYSGLLSHDLSRIYLDD